MSASMYDWNQQKTTIDNPLVNRSNDRRQQAQSRRNCNYTITFLIATHLLCVAWSFVLYDYYLSGL